MDGNVVAINSICGNLAPIAVTKAFQRYAAYLYIKCQRKHMQKLRIEHTNQVGTASEFI